MKMIIILVKQYYNDNIYSEEIVKLWNEQIQKNGVKKTDIHEMTIVNITLTMKNM
jgi:hypothetical protein